MTDRPVGVGHRRAADDVGECSGPGPAPVGRPGSPDVTSSWRSACSGCSTGCCSCSPSCSPRRFATQVIAPTAAGQPGWVSWPVHHAARVIGAHPGPADAVFALVQVAIGVGFLRRRSARVAAAASVLWALGVWFLGEGLGGLAGGTASWLTGGPGAAVLYAVLALAAWPAPEAEATDDRSGVRGVVVPTRLGRHLAGRCVDGTATRQPVDGRGAEPTR